MQSLSYAGSETASHFKSVGKASTNHIINICSAVHNSPLILQLEAAAANVLARFHHSDGEGTEQDFSDLQILLHSSKKFGPGSLRELSVSDKPSISTSMQC